MASVFPKKRTFVLLFTETIKNIVSSSPDMKTAVREIEQIQSILEQIQSKAEKPADAQQKPPTD